MSFLGRLLNQDNLQDLQHVMTNLGFLADAEAQISAFYRLCAGAMPEDADLWNQLADQEIQHSENANKMVARIARDPKLYKPGVSFSTVTARMFAVEMQRLVEQIDNGQIPRDQLLAIALEIENSAVEVSYGSIVKTEDAIFNMLARQNDSQSAEHKAAIWARMNAASPAVSSAQDRTQESW